MKSGELFKIVIPLRRGILSASGSPASSLAGVKAKDLLSVRGAKNLKV